MSSTPYRNLEEDHISVDSADSQGDSAKFSSQSRDGGREYNVEVVGTGGFSSSGHTRGSLDRLKYSKKCLVSILIIILLAFMLIILVAIISHGSKAVEGGSKVEPFFPWKDIRLPTDVEPLEYNIFLNPDLSKGTVMGTVSVVLKATGETDFIVIHALNMTLSDVKLTTVDPDNQRIDSSSYQVKPPVISPLLQAAYLALDKKLEKDGQYNLTMTFSYTLMESLSGFYTSNYMENNVTKVIGSTQMEPVDARRAFPCFDEPQLKANFSLKIVHDRSTNVVLFNTPSISTESFGSNKWITSFETTVSMSTYLVAFVLCDFTSMSDVTSSGTQIAVYSRREQADQMNLALDAMKQIIPFYEEFFAVAYPLAKQDMVAIPNFAAGAMENWGLILYREEALLYKEGVTKSWQQQYVVIVIAHELAHQWFGNLVTMKWWNDLWLNEGFASFVEYLGTDHYMPEWKMMDQFIVDTTHRAMAQDALSESHPISVEIIDPSEIAANFDDITYNKGASVIRMIHDYLGQDVFRDGLQTYLQLHAYGNTESDDLWEALRKATKVKGKEVDVKDLMDYWILQMGYPVVTLRRDKSKVYVTQERFLLDPEARPNSAFKSKYNYKWKIPLTYTYYTGPNIQHNTTLVSPDEEKIITVPDDIAWIKGNSNQSGFYRVNYDLENWHALTEVLLKNYGAIPPADRANLIDDVFHLHRANKLDMDVPFNMLPYLQDEREYVPLTTAMQNLNYIRKVLLFHKVYNNFTIYLEKIFKPVLVHLTMEDKGNHLEKLLRETLVKFLLDNGHSETLQWAADNFAQYRNGNSTVGVNLASIMKCGGVKAGLEDDWTFVWEKFKSNTIASENDVLLRALTCTRDPTILSWLLYESLENRDIKSQDSIAVMSYILDNPVGANIAVNFVMEQWDKLKEQFGSSLFTLSRLIPRMASFISGKVQAFSVIEFLNSKYEDVPAGLQTVIRQAIEHLEINFEFVERNEKKLEQWLAKKLES